MTYHLDMPVEDAMRTQKAIRRLKPDPVDEDLVLHLIDLAIRAPVGGNAQKWEFVVVNDANLKLQLAHLNARAMRLYAGLGRLFGRSSADKSRVLASVKWQMEHFAEIPTIVIVCYHGHPPPLFLAQTSYFGSVYPAVQNLLLAARAAGLGAALITIPLWSPRRIRKLLGLPAGVSPCAVVPLGWPLGRYGPNKRRPVGDVVHVNRYGAQPYRETQAVSRTTGGWGAAPWLLAGGALALAWWARQRTSDPGA